MKNEARVNSRDEKSSIDYQKEENKYILTFSDFNYHIYPHLNESQIVVYNLFSGKFELPFHISPIFINKKPEIGIFSDKERKNSMPFAMRMLLSQLEMVMTSPEFSSKTKIFFGEQIKIYISTLLETNNLSEHSSNEDQNLSRNNL
jgi:hypothetical protein